MMSTCFSFIGKKTKNHRRTKKGNKPQQRKLDWLEMDPMNDAGPPMLHYSESSPQLTFPKEEEKSPEPRPIEFQDMFTSNSQLLSCSELVKENFEKFEMLLTYEKQTDWELKVDKSFAKVFLTKGSNLDPELPMVKALFDLEVNAEPEQIYKLLYDTELRKTWDKNSVLEFKELSKPQEDAVVYYMLNKAPWPFSNRDFVEQRLTRRRENGDIEVFYSNCESQEAPQTDSKVERGRTVIGGQVFRRRVSLKTGEPTLLVTLLNQAEMNGKIPAKALKETLPTSLMKWYRSVKNQLVNLQNS